MSARSAACGASWIEDSADRHHFRKCKGQGRCAWCSYIMCKEKWKDKVQMLPDTPVKTAHLPAATRALASTSWLNRKTIDNSKGVIKLGCTACAEVYRLSTRSAFQRPG